MSMKANHDSWPERQLSLLIMNTYMDFTRWKIWEAFQIASNVIFLILILLLDKLYQLHLSYF